MSIKETLVTMVRREREFFRLKRDSTQSYSCHHVSSGKDTYVEHITPFPSAWYGIDEDAYKNGPFLKDSSNDEIGSVARDELVGLNGLSSTDDIVVTKEFRNLNNSCLTLNYYMKNFSDETVERGNYVPEINSFLNRTHLFMFIHPNDYSIIMRLGVNPKYHGRGIGKNLISVAENISQRFDCSELVLADPVTNLGFWQNFGFLEFPDSYSVGNKKFDTIKLSKKIT